MFLDTGCSRHRRNSLDCSTPGAIFPTALTFSDVAESQNFFFYVLCWQAASKAYFLFVGSAAPRVTSFFVANLQISPFAFICASYPPGAENNSNPLTAHQSAGRPESCPGRIALGLSSGGRLPGKPCAGNGCLIFSGVMALVRGTLFIPLPRFLQKP